MKNVQLTHSNASLTLLWAVPTPHATLHHAPHRWRCPHLCNNLTYLSTPLHKELWKFQFTCLFIYFLHCKLYNDLFFFTSKKTNKKKRTHCKIILNAITVIHCIYGKLLLTTFLQSFKIYVSFQCGTVAINRHLHFSIQQTKLEEPSCFTSASPTAGASSASELAGVISVGF